MRAQCYTVNDAAEVQRLLALGVDGIITDAVDRFTGAQPARASARMPTLLTERAGHAAHTSTPRTRE